MKFVPKSTLACGAFAVLAFCMTASAQAQSGIQCQISENGNSATGTVVITRGAQRMATGSCGSPVSVRPGVYQVRVHLDGVLDRPIVQKRVHVLGGQISIVPANFVTGILEVRILSQGKRGVGSLVVRQGAKRLGTLGSGVAAHISAGTYTIDVEYRGRRKAYRVTIAPGQHQKIHAKF